MLFSEVIQEQKNNLHGNQFCFINFLSLKIHIRDTKVIYKIEIFLGKLSVQAKDQL